jgi:hypothetical protein
MVHKIINTLWKENKWDANLLNSYILNNKPTIQENLQNNQEIINTTNNTPTNIGKHPTTIEELPSLEVKMTERNLEITSTTSNPVELQTTSQPPTNPESDDENVPMDLVGKDILEVSRYEFRNRKFDSLNPFYVMENSTYLLGVLAVNAPGDNSKERKAFVAGSLKLPANSSLVHYVFWNGNNWIAAGFDYKEDLIFCKDKLNTKENNLIKFIQLSPRNKDEGEKKKEKGKDTISQVLPNNNNQYNNAKALPLKYLLKHPSYK